MFYTTNPDYPSADTGSFLQHTNQPQGYQQTYYYPGGTMAGPVNPFANNAMVDSRRNIPMLNQPQPTYNYPQPQMNPSQGVPENQVQAWGTYPPSNPTPVNSFNGTNPGGLNALVESRRNPAMSNTGNVPNGQWNVQQPSYTQPQPMVAPNYGYQNYPGYNMGYVSDPQTQCLYTSQPNSSVIRPLTRGNEGYWDNGYAVPQQIAPPTVDWRAAAAQQQATQPTYYGYPVQQSVQYPVLQYPTAQRTWREIAEENFGNKR